MRRWLVLAIFGVGAAAIMPTANGPVLPGGRSLVVGGIAGATATAESAAAHPRPPCRAGLYAAGCCCLAKPPGSCPGSGTSHTCPPGPPGPPDYHKETWGCCAGGRFYICSECTTGGDCKTGKFACSEAIRTNRNC